MLGGMADIEKRYATVQVLPLEGSRLAADIASHFGSVAEEFHGTVSPGRLGAIEAHISLILIAFHRRLGPEMTTTTTAQTARALVHVGRFRQLIRGFRRHRPLDFYAGRLGLTATHLNRICREHLGDTALGLIHQRTILEAKRYLTFTSLSAKEIALALGFEDPSYFARFFKTQTGSPPLAFRARQNETMG